MGVPLSSVGDSAATRKIASFQPMVFTRTYTVWLSGWRQMFSGERGVMDRPCPAGPSAAAARLMSMVPGSALLISNKSREPLGTHLQSAHVRRKGCVGFLRGFCSSGAHSGTAPVRISCVVRGRRLWPVRSVKTAGGYPDWLPVLLSSCLTIV